MSDNFYEKVLKKKKGLFHIIETESKYWRKILPFVEMLFLHLEEKSGRSLGFFAKIKFEGEVTLPLRKLLTCWLIFLILT